MFDTVPSNSSVGHSLGVVLMTNRMSPRAEHFLHVRQTVQTAMERVNKARSERVKSEATAPPRRNEAISAKSR